MKKVTKATIAAAAAGALLLGGAGTLALWSAEDTVDAGTVETGHLTLEATGTGEWTDESPGAATSEFTPGTDHIVPGDTIVYNQLVTIGADGKNLRGELTVTELTEGDVLPEDVTVDLTVDDSALDVVQGEDGILTFGEEATYEVPVSVTLQFAESATGSMDTVMDLGSMTLTLDQVRS